jgi:hypothetical protein
MRKELTKTRYVKQAPGVWHKVRYPALGRKSKTICGKDIGPRDKMNHTSGASRQVCKTCKARTPQGWEKPVRNWRSGGKP